MLTRFSPRQQKVFGGGFVFTLLLVVIIVAALPGDERAPAARKPPPPKVVANRLTLVLGIDFATVESGGHGTMDEFSSELQQMIGALITDVIDD